MIEKFYRDLDKLFSSFIKLLNEYEKSEILQNYFFELFDSFFYATIINNFFSNLTPKNLKEYGLSIDDRKNIENEYNDIQKDIDAIIQFKDEKELKRVNLEYYNEFKARLKNDFPNILDLIMGLEKEIDMERSKNYLKEKKEEIKTFGRTDEDLNCKILTKIIEASIKKNNRFPLDMDLDELTKDFTNKQIPKIAKGIFESIKPNIKLMLSEEMSDKIEFENILYNDWEEPLDLLECLVMVSLVSVEKHCEKNVQKGFKEDIKFNTLIRIHARALKITNEIIILLKSGYPDGANARWRSLHELAVISFFLSDNENIVSQRYLEHEAVTRFKEAEVYQKYCEKLGYPPHEKEFLDKLKKEKEFLCKKYDKDYHKQWGWIPSSIIKNKNFASLEEHIGLDRLRPFYKLSSAHIHGSSRGFYSIGLRSDFQNKILHIGASNYGLDDPIQSTAISLMHVTNCLLRFKPDFESLVQIGVIHYFIKEIGIKAVEVQDKIEKED